MSNILPENELPRVSRVPLLGTGTIPRKGSDLRRSGHPDELSGRPDGLY